MGRIIKLRDLIGVIKDKASLSKAALLSKPNTLSLHLSVLRATTHSTSTPPDDHHVSAILSLGDSSRATASALITALMDRLHRTSDSTVALKCLLIVHHIINRGPFILQDQISIFPATGGYNYLKLSAFRDNATAVSWALSAWVRWHARYLETLFSSSRVVGYLVCSSSINMEIDNQKERISSLLNVDLVKDIDSLIGLIEEICKLPDNLLLEGNKLVYEVMGLVGNDYLSIIKEIMIRLGELKERLSFLSFGESFELVCGLKRIEDCKDKLFVLFNAQKPSIMESLWGLVDDLKNKVGITKVRKDCAKLLSWGGRDKVSESARFGDRVIRPGDSVHFSSGRFDKDKFLAVEDLE